MILYGRKYAKSGASTSDLNDDRVPAGAPRKWVGTIVRVRFETSRALDAIERRLTTDPLQAGAVIDLVEAARSADLDGGRAAALLRLGLFVDALSRQLSDGGIGLYAVAERGAMSDTDFTSNERMVLRRWSDDGLIEILPAGVPPAARVREIAGLTGLPVVSRAPLSNHPGPVYVTVASGGGTALNLAPSTGSNPRQHPAMGRLWRCPAPSCPSFGQPAQSGAGQSPPSLPSGAPVCPRHGERLVDQGSRPLLVPMAVRIGGLVRTRFLATSARPVMVGRAPDDQGGVTIGSWLDEEGTRRVSRSHLLIEVRDGMILATDVSTNGAVVLARTGSAQQPRRVTLTRDQPYVVGEWDEIELHPEVTIGRADRPSAGVRGSAVPDSVLQDAPTIALRLPRSGSG
jgi:hypothetical protein